MLQNYGGFAVELMANVKDVSSSLSLSGTSSVWRRRSCSSSSSSNPHRTAVLVVVAAAVIVAGFMVEARPNSASPGHKNGIMPPQNGNCECRLSPPSSSPTGVLGDGMVMEVMAATADGR